MEDGSEAPDLDFSYLPSPISYLLAPPRPTCSCGCDRVTLPAPIELRILALLEHRLKLLEIERRSAAFNPHQFRQRAGGFGRITKTGQQLHDAIRHFPVAHQ